MGLDDWIKADSEKRMAALRGLGLTDADISRYRHRKRCPRPKRMRKIIELTDGAVQPNDFYELPELPQQKEAAA